MQLGDLVTAIAKQSRAVDAAGEMDRQQIDDCNFLCTSKYQNSVPQGGLLITTGLTLQLAGHGINTRDPHSTARHSHE